MRSPIVPLVFGLIAVAAPITAYVYTRQVQEDDLRDIRQMQAALDSVRVALAVAPTALDSQRLVVWIGAREAGISRRQNHPPVRQARLDRWWRPTAPATFFTGLGLALIGLALVMWHRRRRANRSGSRTSSRS